MAERPFVEAEYPDWRNLLDTRDEREKAAGQDIMGYDLAPFLAHFTAKEIAAAKAMSALAGYKWDCVGVDPRVHGRRFLDAAKVGLRAAAEVENKAS